MASVLCAQAQTVERTFYIDYGQNNVSGQGNKTVGADKNGHYWNIIFGKGTGAPDKAYPQTISLVTSGNKRCWETSPLRVLRRTISSWRAVRTMASSVSRDSTSARPTASICLARARQLIPALPGST